MKVAVHVDQLYGPAPGGIGTYIRELVPELAAQGAETTLFHSRFEGKEPPEPWMAEFPVVAMNNGIRSLYPRWNLTGRPALPEVLADANVVHAPLPAAVPPVRPGQRLVVTVHDLAFMVSPKMFPARWRMLYRLGLAAAVKRADAIIAPSRNTAEDLVSRTKVDPAKVHVIPEASTLASGSSDPDETLERLRLPRRYVLFVGTLEPRKNLVRLVRAYRRAAADGMKHALVLAGALGWDSQPLMREIALAGPGEILLTGQLPSGDLDAVYRGASAFAYVSTYEGFGLPVLEAMARGIPVVCSNTSSLPEVSGDAALLVDPRSVREITAALLRITTDADLAESLARAGVNRAAEFSWERAARMTLEVYGG